ncbi:MAG: conjugal transfer protein TraX [Oscillospiraceae bacterium]|jgi:hypothetical protein|nr:conjugal transfer protein TraX [Oscillospiraceae bacterium]
MENTALVGRGMNARTLKIIAAVTMVCSHIGVTLNTFYGGGFAIMDYIGRFAAPIFFMLAADGAVKTRDFNKYLLRIVLFAVISEMPFDFLFSYYFTGKFSLVYWGQQNVMWTLAIGVLAIKCCEKSRKTTDITLKILFAACVAGLIILAKIAKTDYDMGGVAFMVACYIFRNNRKLRALAAWFVWVFFVCGLYFFFDPRYEFAAVAAWITRTGVYKICEGTAPLFALLLYNGAQGKRFPKYAFYTFYPAHILIIAAVFYPIVRAFA